MATERKDVSSSRLYFTFDVTHHDTINLHLHSLPLEASYEPPGDSITPRISDSGEQGWIRRRGSTIQRGCVVTDSASRQGVWLIAQGSVSTNAGSTLSVAALGIPRSQLTMLLHLAVDVHLGISPSKAFTAGDSTNRPDGKRMVQSKRHRSASPLPPPSDADWGI